MEEVLGKVIIHLNVMQQLGMELIPKEAKQ